MTSNRFDPMPPARSGTAASGTPSEPMPEVNDDGMTPSESELILIISRAEQISRDYQLKTVDKPLARSYRAWQNLHAEGSKYLGPAFKGRSRLYVPKTRSAVRKNLAATAGALFSTEDVTSIKATHEDDLQQRATAAVIKADLEHRLSNDNPRAGVPWFITAMGACLDSQLSGICLSKQFWEYDEVDTGKDRLVQGPLMNPMTGQPEIDEFGQPILVEKYEPIMRLVKDRPMVELHPIENVQIDPAAPWYAPVQMGRWFACDYPMGLSDARAMLKSSGKRGISMWKEDVSDEVLLKGRVEDQRNGNRRVREGGGDRYEDAARAGGGLDIVWLRENFVRVAGRDWHFWSVGRHAIISEVRETIDAYPEQGGMRPYVMGVAQLDTHRVFPQSPVETWQPLQFELNDITNLRLDTLKRSIAPLAKAKRGKQVDLQALQRRGQPETVLMVDSMDDVEIVQTPGPNGSAFQETSITNSNFDELAGVFSTSSVQQSRQLNETVGGMSLMSRAASSVSEFDLRMFIETWVEPVIRQLAHLVRYYESDEKILAIAGQKARVWSRYDYMPSVEDFDQCDLTVRVNAGIGAVDPVQKLQKMEYAFKMLAPLLPEASAKGISINVEQVIEEVMGAAGFRDGRRFFDFGEPKQSEPPPEMIKIMKDFEARMAKVEADKEKAKGEQAIKLEAIRSGERQSAADNDAVISSSEIEWLGRLAQQGMSHASGDMRANATNMLRKQEAESAERYRMLQLGTPGAEANASAPVENNETSTGISHVLEQLIRHIGVLTEKVSTLEGMLPGFVGMNPPLAQPMMQ